MKRLGLVLALCAALCGSAAAQVGVTFFPGPGMAAQTSVPLVLDGSGFSNTSTGTVTVALTTTHSTGVIVVGIISNSSIVNSVTASGLTFTQRGSRVAGTSASVYEFTAPYSTNFSGNITVSMGNALFTTVVSWGIGGAKTSSFFDSNVSLPATATSGNISGSTSNANDFIYAIYASGTGTPTAGSGWTQIPNGTSNFALVEYKIVSATQSGLTATFTTGTAGGGIFDAIVQGP